MGTPDQLIKENTSISSLPETFLMINETIRDPDSSFDDLARVIGHDTSLTARLLRIVNSSFYGFPQQVETLTHALSIVGTEQLYDLALATTVLTQFKGIRKEWLDMNAFWRHSVGCGIAARVIAQHCRQLNTERYFLSGVLHDVGRLILLENYPDLIVSCLDQSIGDGPLLVDLEQKVLGFHHGDIGAALCRAWNLPPLLEEVIACHHHPATASVFPKETGILYLGNLIATAMQLGCSGDHRVPPLNEGVWNQSRLTPGHLSGIWNQIQVQFEQSVGIVLAP